MVFPSQELGRAQPADSSAPCGIDRHCNQAGLEGPRLTPGRDGRKLGLCTESPRGASVTRARCGLTAYVQLRAPQTVVPRGKAEAAESQRSYSITPIHYWLNQSPAHPYPREGGRDPTSRGCQRTCSCVLKATLEKFSGSSVSVHHRIST